ncbi:MAG: hypothetical protein KIIPBIDF_01522 [Candidatus Methanoperedenaceae archaeon GB50]|nr:MAG: hypothetical protein KIIPBIDF_01522 [Candidatus Methanoperedenaceae archaeon GB50]
MLGEIGIIKEGTISFKRRIISVFFVWHVLFGIGCIHFEYQLSNPSKY